MKLIRYPFLLLLLWLYRLIAWMYREDPSIIDGRPTEYKEKKGLWEIRQRLIKHGFKP